MYRAPVEEIAFTLKHVAGDAPGAAVELSDDLAIAILAEAGRFAGDEIAPLRKIGDQVGAAFEAGAVTMPPGWKDLYRRWSEGGWNGLSAPEAWGGQGLPTLLSVATHEMWNSGSMAFGVGPMLTAGTVEALEAHGSDELKARYLPRLVSGEWTGAMNLTEPQAGSDLAGVKTRAERGHDGTFRLFGQKIYITYGEHDLAENIVHMVLARLPDAPAGSRGISLFLVPKHLPDENGEPGERNDVACAGIEHKLGLHASPTCTMIYGDKGGAVGWLVGEENRGLACMFTMMNNARLGVGIQGVAIAEAATQQALAFANERRQGRAAGHSGDGMSAIVRHPDVQRDLLAMKSLTRIARSICYACAHAVDLSRATAGEEARHWRERANLLTPVAKAFSTDIGMEVASLGIQVHGGMGFIEETGAAALYRDARIAPIYEGTNGIQAIDLVTRKLPQSDGAHVHGYIAELSEVAARVAASNLPGFGRSGETLRAALDDWSEATRFLQETLAAGQVETALAGATPYLRLFAYAAGGAYLAKAALAEGETERVALCRYFAENHLGETRALRERVTGGAESLLAAGAALVSA